MQLREGRIVLRVDGAHLLVVEIKGGREYRRAGFDLGEVLGLLMPAIESMVSSTGREALEGAFAKAMGRAFDETPST